MNNPLRFWAERGCGREHTTTRRNIPKLGVELAASTRKIRSLEIFGQDVGQDDNSRPSSSDRIILGFIGLGWCGRELMQSFKSYLDIDICAVCDVDQRKLDPSRIREACLVVKTARQSGTVFGVGLSIFVPDSYVLPFVLLIHQYSRQQSLTWIAD